MDDGKIGLNVVRIEGKNVVCEVLNDGKISNHKSLNVPNVEIDMVYLSDTDVSDIEFGCAQDVDFIAASFVRCAQDVLDVREILKRCNKDVENTCIDHAVTAHAQCKQGFVFGNRACIGDVAFNCFHCKNGQACGYGADQRNLCVVAAVAAHADGTLEHGVTLNVACFFEGIKICLHGDRKSTRLNSSH